MLHPTSCTLAGYAAMLRLGSLPLGCSSKPSFLLVLQC